LDGTIFYSAFTQLNFQLDSQYFRDGNLIVECKASYPKSPVVLSDMVQSNIKAGFGIHHYALASSAGFQCLPFEIKIVGVILALICSFL